MNECKRRGLKIRELIDEIRRMRVEIAKTKREADIKMDAAESMMSKSAALHRTVIMQRVALSRVCTLDDPGGIVEDAQHRQDARIHGKPCNSGECGA